jgi:hypothetical protein
VRIAILAIEVEFMMNCLPQLEMGAEPQQRWNEQRVAISDIAEEASPQNGLLYTIEQDYKKLCCVIKIALWEISGRSLFTTKGRQQGRSA